MCNLMSRFLCNNDIIIIDSDIFSANGQQTKAYDNLRIICNAISILTFICAPQIRSDISILNVMMANSDLKIYNNMRRSYPIIINDNVRFGPMPVCMERIQRDNVTAYHVISNRSKEIKFIGERETIHSHGCRKKRETFILIAAMRIFLSRHIRISSVRILHKNFIHTVDLHVQWSSIASRDTRSQVTSSGRLFSSVPLKTRSAHLG